MNASNPLITAAQFERHYANRPYELIEGRVVKVRLSGNIHGIVASLVSYELQSFLFTHAASGKIVDNTGFWLSEQTLCAPDVAYIGAEKQMQIRNKYNFLHFAPDLAVEVVSSREQQASVAKRVDLYRQAHVPMIWIVYTDQKLSGLSPRLKPRARLKLSATTLSLARCFSAGNSPQPSVAVYRAGAEVEMLSPDAMLDGGDVLPGFQLKVAELFPDHIKQDS
jgi:Uma2 family endonuclease